LVGLLIFDGWIVKRKGWNSRIGFKQSIINFNYLWFVFSEISVICSNFPYLCRTIKRGKLFYSFQFETRQLNCLNELFYLFYNSDTSKKGSNIKQIKFEFFNYLDYIVLAHWIMSDGSKRNKGITLCTDCFTIQEVVMLINMLIIKFDISPTVHKEKSNYRIYINRKDLNKLLPYIKPYFIDSFLYKIS
jgi:LAGLIDADG DNA endonuclease family